MFIASLEKYFDVGEPTSDVASSTSFNSGLSTVGSYIVFAYATGLLLSNALFLPVSLERVFWRFCSLYLIHSKDTY